MSPEPLDYLEEFCKEVLDVRSLASQHQLNILQTSLPAIWPDLDEMCILENSVFLPREVSRIVLRLLKIRKDTFLKATPRTNTDYVAWPNPEEEFALVETKESKLDLDVNNVGGNNLDLTSEKSKLHKVNYTTLTNWSIQNVDDC